MSETVLAALQLVLLVALAPGLSGAIKRAKAWLQGRQGPPVTQPYFDVLKLLRKDSVVSEHSTAITRAAPMVYAAAFMAAALLAPSAWIPAPLGGAGDAIAIVGLFAVARFALALAGLDTGSAFGGMGASRDVAVAALAEPVLMLAIFAVAFRTGTVDLSGGAAWIAAHPGDALAPSQLLALAALFIAVIAETGRVPADNPDTHLELTMIHEGMLLEFSGRPLGILVWATQLKQVVLFCMLLALFAPFGLATSVAEVPLAIVVFIAKLVALGLFMALIESSNAKLRILRVPQLLGAATTLAVLAIVAEVFLG